jgi:hypothetical protein
MLPSTWLATDNALSRSWLRPQEARCCEFVFECECPMRRRRLIICASVKGTMAIQLWSSYSTSRSMPGSSRMSARKDVSSVAVAVGKSKPTFTKSKSLDLPIDWSSSDPYAATDAAPTVDTGVDTPEPCRSRERALLIIKSLLGRRFMPRDRVHEVFWSTQLPQGSLRSQRTWMVC